MLVSSVASGRFGPSPPTLKGKIEGRKRGGKELGMRGGKSFQGMGGPAGEVPYHTEIQSLIKYTKIPLIPGLLAAKKITNFNT